MSRMERIDLHTERALEELERARGAACTEAAIAHLALSELHLGEVHALSFAVRIPHALSLVGR
jgi:hypothetical protein